MAEVEEQTPNLHMPSMEAWRFGVIWLTALVSSFVATGVVLIVALGWGKFWHVAAHPKPDPAAYDLLFATVIGVVGITLGLYLSSVVALAALGDSGEMPHLTRRLNTAWTFGPILYLCFAVDVLIASAWGYPRTALALALIPIAAGPCVFCMIRMTRTAVAGSTANAPQPDSSSAP